MTHQAPTGRGRETFEVQAFGQGYSAAYRDGERVYVSVHTGACRRNGRYVSAGERSLWSRHSLTSTKGPTGRALEVFRLIEVPGAAEKAGATVEGAPEKEARIIRERAAYAAAAPQREAEAAERAARHLQAEAAKAAAAKLAEAAPTLLAALKAALPGLERLATEEARANKVEREMLRKGNEPRTRFTDAWNAAKAAIAQAEGEG